MPRYKYRARNQAGAVITGQAEADNVELLKTALRERGIWLLHATVKKDFRRFLTKEKTETVRPIELILYTRQLAVMLRSGISLINALTTLHETASANFKPVLARIIEDIKAGRTYAEAISQYPRIFSPFFVGMAEVGEAGGLLSEMHAKLNSHLEQSRDLRSKVLTASIYPLLVLTATVFCVVFILVYAFPKIAEVYKKNNVALPYISQIMVAISGFLTHQWYIPLALILAFLFLIFGMQIHKRQPLKGWLDKLVWKVPFYGRFYRDIIISRFTHNFSLLLQSGVPILRSLEIIKALIGNEVVVDYIDRMIVSIKEGKGMAGYMKTNAFFPALLVSMARTGEESGELAEMMMKTNEFYDAEVDAGLKRIITMVEPVLIIFAAGIVLVVLLAFYLPMFKMFQVLRPQ